MALRFFQASKQQADKPGLIKHQQLGDNNNFPRPNHITDCGKVTQKVGWLRSIPKLARIHGHRRGR
jgi:hypothetical protein